MTSQATVFLVAFNGGAILTYRELLLERRKKHEVDDACLLFVLVSHGSNHCQSLTITMVFNTDVDDALQFLSSIMESPSGVVVILCEMSMKS